MKIGIDIDDTICRTSEIVHQKLEEFGEKNTLNPLDIMNDEVLRKDFFEKYLEDIYRNVEVKKDVVHVLKRLRSKGNQIFIVTARNNGTSSHVTDVESLTREWLTQHGIEVDGIFISAYGEDKGEICRKNSIDLMIEDDPYNYKQIISMGTPCILFDDRGKYSLRENYMTTWLEIERYIERNR